MERIGIFCSANEVAQIYMDAARELGMWLGEKGMKVIYGGANCGLMGLISHTAKEAGATLFGMVPRSLVIRGLESDELDVTFPCEGLADRKDLMMLEGEIFIALPGGIGTLDEIFTVVASSSFNREGKKVILYNIDGFYNPLLEMLRSFEEKGFMRKNHEGFLLVADCLDDIKRIVEEQ